MPFRLSNIKKHNMKICYLTQTASDISDYYKDFFKGKDLFFITFKYPNSNAIGFLPKSTWSDGRNRLWEQVKGKYDYYVFIDDDLRFYNYNSKFSAFPFLSYLFYKFNRNHVHKCFELSKPSYFISRLEYYLKKYKPEVLSVTKVDGDPNKSIDEVMMRRNSFVRRLGYFDAQFTVLSNYAASKILPYDNKISGWWSSQIPVYLYAFHVFAKKAIEVIDLGVVNSVWSGGTYVENYNGMDDCKTMLEEISKATNKDYTSKAGRLGHSPVNHFYGRKEILETAIKPGDIEDYKLNYQKNLQGLEHLLHENLTP
jgi:hypothetical protein